MRLLKKLKQNYEIYAQSERGSSWLDEHLYYVVLNWNDVGRS